jgi:hypothetical protein
MAARKAVLDQQAAQILQQQRERKRQLQVGWRGGERTRPGGGRRPTLMEPAGLRLRAAPCCDPPLPTHPAQEELLQQMQLGQARAAQGRREEAPLLALGAELAGKALAAGLNTSPRTGRAQVATQRELLLERAQLWGE